MSIILDALRRGRGRETPRSQPNSAQTDAVLHTLGYGKFSSTSPFTRVKRLAGYVALSFVFALVLWGTVIWITQPVGPPGLIGRDAIAAAAAPAPTGAIRPDTSRQLTVTPSRSWVRAAQPVALGRSAALPDIEAWNPGEVSISESVHTFDPPGRGGRASAAANQPIVEQSRRLEAPRQPLRQPPASPAVAPSRPALSTAAATVPPAVTTGDDHFRRAVIAQRLGDFETALVHYKQVLQRDDLNVEAHNNLGLLYRDKGLLDDAVREFQRAIAIEPRYARARNNLGVVYLTQRKLDAASSEFHAALALDPRNVESLVNLSTVEKDSGRKEEARTALVRALEIDSRSAEAHYNLGLLEDEAGRSERALAHYKAFIQYGAAGYPTLVAEVRKRVEALRR